MSHGSFAPAFVGFDEQLVRFVRGGDKWFFAVDMRAGLERRHRDDVVQVRLAHGDTDQIRAFLFQHLAVISVAAWRPDFRRDFGAAFGIRIG